MRASEQAAAAKRFADTWKGKGYEKGESQVFWLTLLRDVYGVEHPEEFITFEDQVHLDHTSFIDGMILDTKVMIEQKGINKDLNAKIKQSDGTFLNPFQQAKRYITELPLSKHPRWVVTCNFKEFHVYDMERPGGDPEIIRLENLEKEYYRLQFLVDSGNEHLKREMEVSMKAGDIVGLIYDALYKQYKDPTKESSMKSLNMLCVRLVFCLYAEDAGIFGRKGMFHDYLNGYDVKDMRKVLMELFKVLDTKIEDRDPYLEDSLAEFPYVNGGLFENEDIEIPNFTEEIKALLLNQASDDFDWSEISPTIFGAVFESTLNPETRREGGMHYTSIENIHKVIDPLFLNDLVQELDDISDIKTLKIKEKKLDEFQNKIASLKFFDPACGSGNFLTETYISLRRLENKVLEIKSNGQIVLGAVINPIKVSIQQFYGIEINDFAVTVAKTALWIAESQMMKETERVVHMKLDFLPLKSYVNIVEGNALRLDWGEVVPKNQLNYIMGNPPFHGFTFMTQQQKDDMQIVFPGVKNLDLVCGWYKKASELSMGTNIQTAFVSTNSIVQGETVGRFWEYLPDDIINFAYKTFVWDSEASQKAHVHCVIIGFAKFSKQEKYIFEGDLKKKATNINRYLYDGDNILVKSRNTPICDVPKMIYGNKPADGGYLIIEDEDYEEFVRTDPNSVKYIKPLIGASEYIKGNKRWCLWLEGVEPSAIRKCPNIIERVRLCKESRESSIAAGIRKFAATPTLFAQRTQPVDKDFIVVPRVSSQNRRYVPMGFIKAGTIVTDRVQIIPDADLYEFGIITSNVHMAWMRVTCMRMKSDYSYSKDIVYNNFPWPNPTAEQKQRIILTAQEILDARSKYPNSTLADLYDEVLMPPELRKAHQQNDIAVMKAYGFMKKDEENGKNRYLNEAETVAELMKMYQTLTTK